MASKLLLLVAFLNIIPPFLCRKHTVTLGEETRKDIEITNFGFFQGGSLLVNITNLTLASPPDGNRKLLPLLGFTLDMSSSYESASYAEDHATKRCVLKPGGVDPNDSVATVYLTLNFTDTKTTLDINRWGRALRNVKIVPAHGTDDVCRADPIVSVPASAVQPMDDGTLILTRRRRDAGKEGTPPVDSETLPADAKSGGEEGGTGLEDAQSGKNADDSKKTKNPPQITKLPVDSNQQGGLMMYNTSFVVCIQDKSQEGLYSFFFHHCRSEEDDEKKKRVNLSIKIIETNVGPNYLSAGDIPLPTLYSAMSVLFFCSAIYWIYYLCHQPTVFKIHYLMFCLALIKSLSLMFHAADYHFIAQDGRPMQAFEILFYITYLLKGSLLFGTIVLIGSGWAFIKPILSDQDKKLFWIIIPLQIFANVAYIITDSSEEAIPQYYMWRVMFVTVDIICCGAILYPVIWSIRHLQDAAHTDGKAAISLVKLKLFRSYYVLVVCYIYFSRIVVYLLKVTMPFQFMWLDEFFFELATYVFYILTAYKFRPGTDNPYLQLPSDDEYEDEEVEMEEVLTESAVSEGVKRVGGGNGTTRAIQREANHSA